MDKFWKWFTFLFLSFLAIGILIKARAASLLLGTLFTGTNSLGRTVEGR